MIIDPKTGQPTASDGPTGRQFNVIEIAKDGKRSWAVLMPSGTVPVDADEASEFLLQHGYIVRSGNALGTPGYVRITLGTEEQNTGLFRALTLLLQEKGR